MRAQLDKSEIPAFSFIRVWYTIYMIWGLRANQALFILGALSALTALALGGQGGFFLLLFSQFILLSAVISVWLNK